MNIEKIILVKARMLFWWGQKLALSDPSSQAGRKPHEASIGLPSKKGSPWFRKELVTFWGRGPPSHGRAGGRKVLRETEGVESGAGLNHKREAGFSNIYHVSQSESLRFWPASPEFFCKPFFLTQDWEQYAPYELKWYIRTWSLLPPSI